MKTGLSTDGRSIAKHLNIQILKKLKLTSHEYKIIEYFLHHQEKVITRTELVEHIYDQDFDRDSNTIEVFIGRLRKKMGNNLIKTERGYGYRLSLDKE